MNSIAAFGSARNMARLTPDEIARLEAHMSSEHFTDAQIAQAERLLQSAFRTLVQGSSSSSDIFSGRPKRDHKLNHSTAAGAFVELGDNQDNMRKVRRDEWATRVHASSSAKAQFSRPPLDELGYAYAAVHRVVNELPERHLVLIKATYMPKGPQQAEFKRRLLNLFWLAHQAKIAAGTDRSVLFAMAEIVVEIRGGDEKPVAGMVRDWLQLARSTWYKTYLPAWRHLVTEYRQIHHDAICAFLDAN